MKKSAMRAELRGVVSVEHVLESMEKGGMKWDPEDDLPRGVVAVPVRPHFWDLRLSVGGRLTDSQVQGMVAFYNATQEEPNAYDGTAAAIRSIEEC